MPAGPTEARPEATARAMLSAASVRTLGLTPGYLRESWASARGKSVALKLWMAAIRSVPASCPRKAASSSLSDVIADKA